MSVVIEQLRHAPFELLGGFTAYVIHTTHHRIFHLAMRVIRRGGGH